MWPQSKAAGKLEQCWEAWTSGCLLLLRAAAGCSTVGWSAVGGTTLAWSVLFLTSDVEDSEAEVLEPSFATGKVFWFSVVAGSLEPRLLLLSGLVLRHLVPKKTLADLFLCV